MENLPDLAERHIGGILALAVTHSAPASALVVYDQRCELSTVLTEGYRRCLPGSVFLDFDSLPPDDVRRAFDPLQPGDLVVLIQSTSFRLEAFRVRVELFKRGLKVIEHPHLERMTGPQARWYIDSLAYDAPYYRNVGRALKERIDQAASGTVDSGGERLVFASPFEPAKLNVGDYAAMKNVGGQFPIGEVFTEAKVTEAVQRRVRIFAFADTAFQVNKPEKPATLVVERGRVTQAFDATDELEKVLANIRADEGEVWVRELGFGMNRAFTPERIVCDIGTYERMLGIHLSLGAKHAIYPKPGFTRRESKHHVDVFAVTKRVLLGDEEVFRNGAWTV